MRITNDPKMALYAVAAAFATAVISHWIYHDLPILYTTVLLLTMTIPVAMAGYYAKWYLFFCGGIGYVSASGALWFNLATVHMLASLSGMFYFFMIMGIALLIGLLLEVMNRFSK